MANYWEQHPLHIARPAPDWYADLPGAIDIDELLGHAGTGEIRLVRTKRGVPTEMRPACDDGRLDLAAAYRAYNDGWSLIINHVHATSPQIGRLAADLEEAVNHKIGVNLYFTPRRTQGFAPHADGHDVFLLQLAGCKRWRVFAPVVDLPLEEQKIPVARRQLGPRLIDAVVEPGHALYIPRGFIHEGSAQSTASIHLTIGIHPFRWADLIGQLVTVVSERDVALRHSVPMHRRLQVPPPKEFERNLSRVHAALKDPDVAHEAWLRLVRQKVRGSHPTPDGHFVAIDRAHSIGLGTRLERRRGLDCLVSAEGDSATLEFGANRVDGPIAIEPALRFVAAGGHFFVRDLPDELTDASKVILTRRLVLEGLLTIDDSPLIPKGEKQWRERQGEKPERERPERRKRSERRRGGKPL